MRDKAASELDMSPKVLIQWINGGTIIFPHKNVNGIIIASLEGATAKMEDSHSHFTSFSSSPVSNFMEGDPWRKAPILHKYAHLTLGCCPTCLRVHRWSHR